ncbi:MAG: VWA domain-containing protein [bacterium]|nr:VWA domain-containing protein [bacterium]
MMNKNKTNKKTSWFAQALVMPVLLSVIFLAVFLVTALPVPLEAASPRVKFVNPIEDRIWVGVMKIAVDVKDIDPALLESVSIYLDGNLVKEFQAPPYSLKYDFGQSPKNRTLEVLARTRDNTRLRHMIRSYYADDAHTVNVMQVVVPVVVRDRRGNYISGLKKEDFIIYEDGVPQETSYFSAGGQSTFHLVLLIDISSSMKDKIAGVKDIAKIFLRQLLRSDDKAIIVFFNHDVFEDSDFTSDIDELDNSLSIAFPFGATALYDAVAYSVKLMKSIIGQNIIIIFSDGEDNSSAIDPYTLMKIVARSNSVIYAIGKEMDDYNQYQDLMKKIANSSGGMPFFFENVEDIRKLYQKIRKDIQAKYVLQFAPKNNKKQNRFRKLSVKIHAAAEKRIGRRCKVRTMKGYFY